MATARYPVNDLRRQVGSPKSSKGSENNKDTPCRNIRIYGRCRYEDSGCTFNHDMDKIGGQNESNSKKTLSVESPPFTPSTQNLQQQQQQQHVPPKKSVLSQAASAAPFTPRGNAATAALQPNTEQTRFNVATSREFKPQNYEITGNTVVPNNDTFPDPFMSTMGSPLNQAVNYNPYANEQTGLGGPSGPFYNPHGSYPPAQPLQPPNYHLYQPHDGYRGDLQPWQRATYDFFIPDDLRRLLQQKMWAASQVVQLGLPHLDRYHSLVPLDNSGRKSSSTFGYSSWVYKAQSTKNGMYYVLRRLADYRLTNENPILAVMKEWKKIKNASIVTVHEAFTTRGFGDSSLMFAYDYHPLAKTLLEAHFPSPATAQRPLRQSSVQEPILWSYICQIANALRAIHSSKLAARCIELGKIILTDKNRIRLSACSILDVVQYENSKPIVELQQQDLVSFGKVMVALATNNPNIQLTNVKAAMDALGSKYTANFKDAVTWLATSSPPGEVKTINNFISGIASQMAHHLDLSFQESDEKGAILCRELENGRIARIMFKINTITERGELGNNPNWSENGDRYMVKIFRDYVFHPVDPEGKPVLSIGHMIACLSKLDAGSEEQMILTSRDNKLNFVCTYKEMRAILDRSFSELVKYSKHGAPGAN